MAELFMSNTMPKGLVTLHARKKKTCGVARKGTPDGIKPTYRGISSYLIYPVYSYPPES